MRLSPIAAILIACAIALPQSGRAVPPEAIQSVVSVLPVWPGRAQGGAGAPPGVAPEGSGVVVEPGLIATAWHVVEPAQRIDVRLFDGRVLPARLVAHDAATDIALLEMAETPPPFTAAPTPALSDPVCAIGNAFGLGVSVTCGVVSALGVTDAGFNPVEDFVQTDAATNPGSSGGALVNEAGELVGMVSAIFASEGDANIGVNFAVSGPLLQRVVTALRSEGSVTYSSAGWRLRHADREALRVSPAPVVTTVEPSGSAAQAGVAPGDRVLAIGTRSIRSPRDAIAALALIGPEEAAVPLTLLREGAQLEVILPLGRGSAETLPAATGDCPHPTVVCNARQAVFPVTSFDPVGSAVRIGPDLLVTNRHVVGDRPDAIVHTPDGPRGATVLPSAFAGDLALLRADGLPEEGRVLTAEQRAAGDGPFFAIGADIALQEVRVFEPGGLIAAPAAGAPLGRLHVTAWMQPGVSGGALVDEAGQLVGIATGGGEGRFEALPVSSVTALLEGQGAPEASAVQTALGGALVACAEQLDAWQQGAVAAPDLAEICREGDNAGQMLEAGQLLAQSGALGEGARLHARVVEQTPNSLNARISLLVSLQLAGRFEEMLPHARRVIELAPDDPQVLRFAIQSGVWGGDPALAEAGHAALLLADPRQAQAARRFIDAPPPAPPRR